MREWIMEQGILFYFFCSAGVLGAAATAMANRTYKRLIKEADAMENSEHRLIKYIKLKYSSYYTLGLKANDEKAMVKRYLYRYKIGPLTLMTWSKMGLAMLGAVVLACMGMMLYSLNNGAAFSDMFSMIVAAAMVSLVLGMQYKLYGFKDKQSVFCAQMEDNLQNFLKNKIEYGHVLKRQSGTDIAADAAEEKRRAPAENFSENAGEKVYLSKEHSGRERREYLRHERKAEMQGQSQAAAAGHGRKNTIKKTEDSIYTKAALQLADGFGTEEIDAGVVEDILKEFLN